MKPDLKIVYATIDKNFERYIEEIRKYLRFPAISYTGEGIQEAAEETAKYIRAIGGEAKLVPLSGPTAGYPVVYGKIKSKNPNAKTLIYYSHYDDVLVTPEDWTFPPFAAEIVDAEKIDLPASLGKVIVARSATDKKGVNLSFILAIGTIKEVMKDIPVNIIWVLEGEEEIGSPNFKQFVDAYADELKEADACYASGTFRQFQSGLLVVQTGYNGHMQIELEIKGGDWGGTTDGKGLWSAYAAFVDQPMLRLIHAISSLITTEGEVLVEGFYDNWIPPTADELKEIEKTIKRFSETGIMSGLTSVKRFKKGLSPEELFKDYLTKPQLIPVGISSGYKELAPMEAKAKFHCRFCPNMSSDDILKKIKRHLNKNGFPEIDVTCGTSRNEWSRSPISEDIVQAVISMAKIHGVDYVVWPSSGASNPTYLFNRPPFNNPVVFASLGHGSRLHQHDEYITVEGMRDHMKGVVTFLYEYAGR